MDPLTLLQAWGPAWTLILAPWALVWWMVRSMKALADKYEELIREDIRADARLTEAVNLLTRALEQREPR